MSSKIFCLEGEWYPNNIRENSSVEPYLRFLKDTMKIPYFFRRVNAKDSFQKYLHQLGKKSNAAYSIVYFAFHGTPGAIDLDSKESITLQEIAEIAEEKGLFKKKVLLFSSCSTFDLDPSELPAFKKKTGAKLIAGYSQEIDFFDSALLDLAFLNRVAASGGTRKIEHWINNKHPMLQKELGFTIIK